jgi:hypothetical protein
VYCRAAAMTAAWVTALQLHKRYKPRKLAGEDSLFGSVPPGCRRIKSKVFTKRLVRRWSPSWAFPNSI